MDAHDTQMMSYRDVRDLRLHSPAGAMPQKGEVVALRLGAKGRVVACDIDGGRCWVSSCAIWEYEFDLDHEGVITDNSMQVSCYRRSLVPLNGH